MILASDSNILVILSNLSSPFYTACLSATQTIMGRGDELVIFPQNLGEFWVAATRPVSANGLGMKIPEAEKELRRIKTIFRVYDETPAIYPEWERLILVNSVLGKSIHDTRIVAQMNVHGIDTILTFNTRDFHRYADINAVDPATV